MTRKYDLTSGGIMSKLLLVAWPIMITQLFQMSYNLADVFWLGRLNDGGNAVAASGTAGMFMWLGMAFLMVGRMGAEIGVAQNLGRGNTDAARKFAQNALFIGAVLGILYAAVCMTANRPLISFFNIPETEISGAAEGYLLIVAIGIPFQNISAVVSGTFTGSGNSRLPFIANAIGLTMNLILDPLFIFTFDMGIDGAAVATVISQFAVFVIMLIALKKNKDRPFNKIKLFVKPKMEILRQIFKWAIPISAESLLFTMLSMIINRFVAGYESALSVMRVGTQIESMSWLIGGGFGSAITAFTGQNYGAGKWTRIHKSRRVSFTVMTVYGAFVSLVMFFFGKQLVGLFLQEEELRVLGAGFLRILAVSQIAGCLEAVSAGVLRGIGKTVPPSIISISANVIRVPICYALSFMTPLGLDGIWAGMTIGMLIRGFSIFAWCILDARKRPKTDVLPAAA